MSIRIILIFTLLLPYFSHAGIEVAKNDLLNSIKSGKKPVLVIVDVQDFFEEELVVQYEKLKNIDDMLVFADKNDVEIINVMFPGTEDGEGDISLLEYIYKIKHKTFFKAHEGAFVELKDNDSISELLESKLKLEKTPEGSEIIKTSLDSYLKEQQVKELFISGCFEDMCVKQTALGALENGYDVNINKELTIPSTDDATDWSDLTSRFKGKIKITSNSQPRPVTSKLCSIM